MRVFHHAASHSQALSLAAFVIATGLGGCARDGQRQAEDTAETPALGSVGVELTVAPGVVFASLSFALAGPAGFSRTDIIDVTKSATLGARLGNVPAGSGYTISVAANSLG